MGFLDNVASAVNRGSAAAGRSADKMKIKSQLADIAKRRQGLVAQLGASLYEDTRNDPTLRQGRERLYDGIAALDAERDECNRQIAAIDAAAAAAEEAARVYTCSVCGARLTSADMFCAGCGTPFEQAVAQQITAQGAPCPTCGAPLNEGDRFCMNCGATVPEPSADAVMVTEEAVTAAPMEAPVAAGLVCASCGNTLAETDRFCLSCGAPVAAVAQTMADEAVAAENEFKATQAGGTFTN